jgi:hypothetical protein
MRNHVLLDLIHFGIPVEVSLLIIHRGVVGIAYVLPSYSKIGSQPMENEHCRKDKSHLYHLTEVCGTPCWDYLALVLVRRGSTREKTGTYICATLEDDRLMARAFTICKCTYCLCRLVGVGDEEIIKSLVTECV